RHAATHSLLTRRDVIIVASVSCIHALGSAEAYYGMLVFLEQGQEVDRQQDRRQLEELQYERQDWDFHRGSFRVRGDTIEVFPAYEEDRAVRIELWGDEVEAISMIDPLTGKVIKKLSKVAIYPGSHYVAPEQARVSALENIRIELRERLQELRGE